MGDKTQLLARFQPPGFASRGPSCLAFCRFTIANHAMAGAPGCLGHQFCKMRRRFADPRRPSAMAVDADLDKLDDDEDAKAPPRFCLSPLWWFFLAEMG
jgi:putative Ca2+/H+ antiporter (TMEM165/GDT1 family)